MWQSDQLREMIHPILVGHPDRSDEEGKVAYFAVVGGDTAFSSKSDADHALSIFFRITILGTLDLAASNDFAASSAQ
jgi:hypothetical protein